MASLLSNLKDTVAYKVHEMTYNPEAEKFAEERRKEQEELTKKKEQNEQVLLSNKEKHEDQLSLQKIKTQWAAKQADFEQRANFSVTRMLSTITQTTLSVFITFILVLVAILGASLATNLNLYKSWPYRIFYAIYGFLFCFVVIPYVLLYRWWWKEKRPRFYSLIPLMPYRFDHPWMAQFFSWMSYKPDDLVDSLKEWQTWKQESA